MVRNFWYVAACMGVPKVPIDIFEEPRKKMASGVVNEREVDIKTLKEREEKMQIGRDK